MKKVLSILLVLAIVFTFVACNSKGDASSDKGTSGNITNTDVTNNDLGVVGNGENNVTNDTTETTKSDINTTESTVNKTESTVDKTESEVNSNTKPNKTDSDPAPQVINCPHTITTIKTFGVTCTTDGVKKIMCEACGKVFAEIVAEKLSHQNFTTKTVKATCTKDGSEKRICTDCGKVIKETILPKLAHKNTTTKTVKATCTATGSEKTICNDCGKVIKETTLAKTAHKTSTVTTAATCIATGSEKTVCTVCNTTLSTKTIAKKSHSFALIKEVQATPLADGYKTYQCSYCKESSTTTLKFQQVGATNLFIPSVGINCEVRLCKLNQTEIDKYDVCCDMNFINNNNPLFVGHNFRTFSKLHKLKKGDLIYFTIDGRTTVYKVTISELGTIINNDTNIRGDVTGTLIYNPCTKNTLHFYTCHPTEANPKGRWIVLAEKV